MSVGGRVPKTVLVFRGPAHHSQLLRPVEDELERLGWQVVRYTANTEAIFQAGLAEEFGLGVWKWLPDYADPAVVKKDYSRAADKFRELYRTPNQLSLLTPQVLDRIVWFVCQEEVATRRLMEAVRPQACLALHELNRWSMLLGYWARRLGVPFYTLQEGMYYGDPWIYTGHTRYSKCMVWGEATKKILEAAGCEPGRIVVVGHPDIATRYSRGLAEKDILERELPEELQGRRLVVFFFGHVQVHHFDETLFDGLEESGLVFVARTHQLAALPYVEGVKKFWQHPFCYLSPTSRPDTYRHHWRLMANAELCVSVGCSTTSLEWLYSGKPLGQISSPAMYRNFAGDGLAIEYKHDKPLPAWLLGLKEEWEKGGYAERAREFVKLEIEAGDAAVGIARAIHNVGG